MNNINSFVPAGGWRALVASLDHLAPLPQEEEDVVTAVELATDDESDVDEVDIDAENALISITSDDEEEQAWGFGVLETRIRQGRAIPEAIEIAQEGIRSDDASAQEVALKLFVAVVRQGQAFPQAIEAASVGLMSEEEMVQVAVLEVLEALAHQGQAYAQAGVVATHGRLSEHASVRALSLTILNFLTQQDGKLDEGIRV